MCNHAKRKMIIDRNFSFHLKGSHELEFCRDYPWKCFSRPFFFFTFLNAWKEAIQSIPHLVMNNFFHRKGKGKEYEKYFHFTIYRNCLNFHFSSRESKNFFDNPFCVSGNECALDLFRSYFRCNQFRDMSKCVKILIRL